MAQLAAQNLNTMEKNVLASGLDILFADRAYEIEKQTVMTYAVSSDSEEVQTQLNEWSAEGKLLILKPLTECDDMEKCIKLLTWIQPRNPDGGPRNMG